MLPSKDVAATHLQCQNCGASLSIAQGVRTVSCPYCASPQVIDRPPDLDSPSPSFVLGFALAREPSLALARRWLSRRSLFTVSGVRTADIEAIRGVYLPVYLYSSTAHSRFAVEIGEEYTRRRNNSSKQVTEWRPLQGVRSEYVTDVVVTASRGIANAELEAVEPFDLRALHRYSSAMISGWIAEDPSLGLDHCLELARTEAHQLVGQNLSGFLPGDRYRNLRHETWFQQESLILVLVPLWVLALRYDERKPPFRLLLNGQTGKMWGKAPISWIKIALTIGAGLMAALGLLTLLIIASALAGSG